jgi:hypothetical protein
MVEASLNGTLDVHLFAVGSECLLSGVIRTRTNGCEVGSPSRSCVRAVAITSFAPQGRHRIDARGPAGGEPCGGRAYDEHQ